MKSLPSDIKNKLPTSALICVLVFTEEQRRVSVSSLTHLFKPVFIYTDISGGNKLPWVFLLQEM